MTWCTYLKVGKNSYESYAVKNYLLASSIELLLRTYSYQIHIFNQWKVEIFMIRLFIKNKNKIKIQNQSFFHLEYHWVCHLKDGTYHWYFNFLSIRNKLNQSLNLTRWLIFGPRKRGKRNFNVHQCSSVNHQTFKHD